MWVAPNLLTFVGFLCCFGHFGLLALYDYDFTSATYPGEESVPGRSDQKIIFHDDNNVARLGLVVCGAAVVPGSHSGWY